MAMNKVTTAVQHQTVQGLTSKPDLLTVEDAKVMSLPRMTEIFTKHLNPGQLHFMKLLGFHKVKIERADNGGHVGL